ncbi:MAG: hypothetical protein K1060chlam5_00642 [Candidatus Anoxychlamydiales bacterium]|nr:hypothetical protein [Candidatus Anoxychlamydiales bacterium]
MSVKSLQELCVIKWSTSQPQVFLESKESIEGIFKIKGHTEETQDHYASTIIASKRFMLKTTEAMIKVKRLSLKFHFNKYMQFVHPNIDHAKIESKLNEEQEFEAFKEFVKLDKGDENLSQAQKDLLASIAVYLG